MSLYRLLVLCNAMARNGDSVCIVVSHQDNKHIFQAGISQGNFISGVSAGNLHEVSLGTADSAK